MEQVLFSTIPLESLTATISQIVRSELANSQNTVLQEKLLSPSETCRLFQPNISKVTLSAWTKQGRLKERRIGGRVYYKYSEVMDSLTSLKRYKRNDV